MKRRSFTVSLRAFFSLLILLAAATAALAHAVVIESVPRDGAVLPEAPREVLLRFNARIEQALTKVSLVRAGGKEAGKVIPLPAQGPGPSAPDRVRVLLPPLAKGDYQLIYKVLAADGHATLGGIRFTVTGGAGR